MRPTASYFRKLTFGSNAKWRWMNILYTVYREPAHQTAHIVQRFLYVKGPQYKRQKILNQTNETENKQKGVKLIKGTKKYYRATTDTR